MPLEHSSKYFKTANENIDETVNLAVSICAGKAARQPEITNVTKFTPNESGTCSNNEVCNLGDISLFNNQTYALIKISNSSSETVDLAPSIYPGASGNYYTRDETISSNCLNTLDPTSTCHIKLDYNLNKALGLDQTVSLSLDDYSVEISANRVPDMSIKKYNNETYISDCTYGETCNLNDVGRFDTNKNVLVTITNNSNGEYNFTPSITQSDQYYTLDTSNCELPLIPGEECGIKVHYNSNVTVGDNQTVELNIAGDIEPITISANRKNFISIEKYKPDADGIPISYGECIYGEICELGYVNRFEENAYVILTLINSSDSDFILNKQLSPDSSSGGYYSIDETPGTSCGNTLSNIDGNNTCTITVKYDQNIAYGNSQEVSSFATGVISNGLLTPTSESILLSDKTSFIEAFVSSDNDARFRVAKLSAIATVSNPALLIIATLLPVNFLSLKRILSFKRSS
jgi:hypothetical protein